MYYCYIFLPSAQGRRRLGRSASCRISRNNSYSLALWFLPPPPSSPPPSLWHPFLLLRWLAFGPGRFSWREWPQTQRRIGAFIPPFQQTISQRRRSNKPFSRTKKRREKHFGFGRSSHFAQGQFHPFASLKRSLVTCFIFRARKNHFCAITNV